MILETAQLLCGVHHVIESKLDIPYKLSHKNHPCSIWARECIENYTWLCNLGLELAKEYTFRYEKLHKSQAVIEWCIKNKPKLPKKGNITKFALAMPDEYKFGGDIKKAYAPITSVEKIEVGYGKTFYKLSIDGGYNRDIIVNGATYGEFTVEPSTRIIGECYEVSGIITLQLPVFKRPFFRFNCALN